MTKGYGLYSRNCPELDRAGFHIANWADGARFCIENCPREHCILDNQPGKSTLKGFVMATVKAPGKPKQPVRW